MARLRAPPSTSPKRMRTRIDASNGSSLKGVAMRRIVIILTALAALLALTAPPASADGVVKACSGYYTRASISASGHRLSTQGNACLHDHGPVANQQFSWGGVVRFKCYRDDQPFGDGTGGCRWAGYVTLELEGVGEIVRTYVAEPGSSSDIFISDSGRMWSYTTPLPAGRRVRGCWRDGVVRFMGITGINYGLYNTIDFCGTWNGTGS
jgi:hypothetical protein